MWEVENSCCLTSGKMPTQPKPLRVHFSHLFITESELEGTYKVIESSPLPMQAVLNYKIPNRWLTGLCLKSSNDGESATF